MSDYVPQIPYAPGSPEYEQFLRAQAVAPLSVGVGALTQVMPFAADDQGNITRPGLPGIVTGGYGMIGATVPDLVNRFTGTNLGHLPGAEFARSQYEQAANAAQDALPSERVAASTGDPHIEQAGQIGQALGAATVPLPGAIGGALTRLPNAARIPIEMVAGAPTAAHVPGAMIAAPVLSGGLLAATQPGQDQSKPFEIPDPRDIPDPRVDAQASQGGTTKLPFDTTSPSQNQMPVPPIPPAQVPPMQTNLVPATGTSGQVQDQVSPPTYGAEGETWSTYATRTAETLGALALAFGVAKYGGKYLINPVAERLSAFKPDSAASANAAIAARDAGQQAVQSTLSGKNIEAPLPAAPGQSAPDAPTTRLANSLYDKTRIASSYIDATQPVKPLADALKNSLGTTESSAAFGDKIHAQMSSGVNMFTGAPGVRWEDIAAKVNNDFTPQQYATLDAGMHAGAELDYRNNNGNQYKNFVNTDTPTLQAAYNAMQADPDVMAVRNMIQNAHRDVVNTEVQMGLRTQADATAHLQQNPNWMPELTDKGGIRTIGTPDTVPPYSGWDRPPTDVMNAQVQAYHDQLFNIQQNTFRRDFIKNGVDWQNVDPNRPQVFTERKFTDPNDPNAPPITGTGGAGRTISFMDGGVKKTYNVNSTVMHSALVRNDVQGRLPIDIMNRIRQGFTSLTTGPAAIVGGRPFAPIQFARSALQIPIERTAGTSAGLLDRAMQGLTGGQFGIRGDPTFALQMGNQMFRNMGAVIAKNTGQLFENKAASAPLRALIGDKWVDASATRLKQLYGNSNLAGNIQAGITKAAGQTSVEPPMFLTGGQSKGPVLGQPKYSYINPLAGTYPEAFSGMPDKVRIPGAKGATGQFIFLRNLLHDLHAQVAEAGNAAYYRANLNNPRFSPDTMARLSRSVIGDPGMTGASPAMQQLGKSIPYFNPIVQEAVRMVRNFRDAPVASVTGEVGTMLTLAMASTMTAMMAGNAGVDHLENQMTTQQRAADATFYHDPTNPLNNTQISLPQRWRPIYPYVLEMVSTAMGAWQAHQGEPLYDRAMHMMTDFFSHHVQTSTDTSALHGLSSMTDISLPPGINAAIAGLGGDVGELPGNIIENIRAGRPVFQDMLRSGGEGPDKIPGQMGGVSGSTYLSQNDGKWRDAILSELGGSLVNAYHTFIGTPWERMSEGAGLASAISGMGSDVLQNFRDGMPWGNIVWGNTAKLNKFDPMAEGVSNAMANIRNLGDVADATTLGATGLGGMTSMVLNANKVPDDPVMRQLYDKTIAFAPTMEPLEKERNSISMIMQQIQSGGDSAQDKRRLLNDYTRQYADLTAEMDGRIRLLNADLSHTAGDRVVDIHFPINWQGTVQQFHP